MKRGIQIVLLFFILFTFTNCKKNNTNIVYSKRYIEEIKQTREELRIFMGSNFVPGAGITISKKGEILYSESVGYASKDLNVKADRNTKFRIGTLSGLFTSAIYFKLVEEGKLHPDSSIRAYYPDFPEKGNSITLRHLVQNASGIREPNTEETAWSGFNITLEKGIEKFKDDPLVYDPGQHQLSSLFNYNLLGLIMEKVKKERYNKLLKNYLTDTLHMENTVVDNPYSTIENRSDFYDHNMISQVVNATSLDLRHRAPSDGILSNSEDLVRFGNALLKSDYFSADTRENLFKPIVLGNNLESGEANGWIILMDRKGKKLYGKDGAVKGGSASILVYPEDELIIAFTTNLTGVTNNFPIFKIAEFFLPKEEKKEKNKEEQSE